METYNSIRPVDPLVNEYLNHESNVKTDTVLDSKNINNINNIKQHNKTYESKKYNINKKYKR